MRRGDSLSPIFFNFVVDGLARMIRKAQVNGLISGLIDHFIEGGVAILQYADDTIICLKHSLEGARNLKLLVYMYELMAGLKVNFYKSEILNLMIQKIGQAYMLISLTDKLGIFQSNQIFGCSCNPKYTVRCYRC